MKITIEYDDILEERISNALGYFPDFTNDKGDVVPNPVSRTEFISAYIKTLFKNKIQDIEVAKAITLAKDEAKAKADVEINFR